MKDKDIKLIISRYAEDLSWLDSYDYDYVVYNKGEPINPKYNEIKLPNIGNNQRDIFHFIIMNYDKLPETMVFLQGSPYEHCTKVLTDLLIEKRKFAILETSDLVGKGYWGRDKDGLFMEINNSWYIDSKNQEHNKTCKYKSYDEFMKKYFIDYEHQDWIKFSPGSQYIIEKSQALKYIPEFWFKLMNELPENNMTEGHIVERALYSILEGKLTPRDFEDRSFIAQ